MVHSLTSTRSLHSTVSRAQEFREWHHQPEEFLWPLWRKPRLFKMMPWDQGAMEATCQASLHPHGEQSCAPRSAAADQPCLQRRVALLMVTLNFTQQYVFPNPHRIANSCPHFPIGTSGQPPSWAIWSLPPIPRPSRDGTPTSPCGH